MTNDLTAAANRFRFRAWHSETRKMIDLHAITPLALDSNFNQDGVFLPFDDRIVLMQSTGLLDKNGKEIFEGDIVEYDKNFIGKPFHDDTFRFRVVFGHGGFILADPEERRDCPGGFCAIYLHTPSLSVIGNIYENPELLSSNPS